MKRKTTYEVPEICVMTFYSQQTLLAALSGSTDDGGRFPSGGDDNDGREGDAKGYEKEGLSPWEE